MAGGHVLAIHLRGELLGRRHCALRGTEKELFFVNSLTEHILRAALADVTC